MEWLKLIKSVCINCKNIINIKRVLSYLKSYC